MRLSGGLRDCGPQKRLMETQQSLEVERKSVIRLEMEREVANKLVAELRRRSQEIMDEIDRLDAGHPSKAALRRKLEQLFAGDPASSPHREYRPASPSTGLEAILDGIIYSPQCARPPTTKRLIACSSNHSRSP